MKRLRVGKRHPLLFYRRTLDRLWPTLFLCGAILLTIGIYVRFARTPLHQAEAPWLMLSGGLPLALSLFFLLLRHAAYVQAHPDHLRLVTPFLQMRISYRRIRSTHPAELDALFPPQRVSAILRSFLAPLYGRTAVVLELNGYPLPKPLLRLFLAPAMFHPHTEGLVLLVPDWIAFSSELDTLRADWIGKSKQTGPAL
ncbi:MAG: hypothetical protein RML93_13030 [Anaerolineales bacterium]|nr:hypothetical protein [Anaerolineales bacterium]MDW8448199.1 hypothetical protein [Anaerolineales bacterium]